MRGLRILAPLALLALSSAAPVQAALFDDEEARRAIRELRASVNERVETQARAQLELASQIEAVRADLARVRGSVETQGFELETGKKRSQDYYVDLDARLRKLEAAVDKLVAASVAPPPPAPGSEAAGAAAALKPDPEAEAREYEAALNQFKAAAYKEAASAFAAFVSQRGHSTLAPSAQYWLGNALYAQRKCKEAIEAQNQLIARWPEHAKVPDALLNIATCQQELGDSKAARGTLEKIVSQHPGAQAAETAGQRLKKK